MKQLKLFATALLLAGVGGVLPVVAQTDVTSQYLQNPSFELSAENTRLSSVQKTSSAALSMYGWTETGVPENYNDTQIMNVSTENASVFGKLIKPSDGDYYFFVRQGWNSGANNHIVLTSNDFSLPSGRYELSINYKQAHSWDNGHKNSFDTKVSLAFNSNNSDVCSSSSGAAPASPGTNYFNTSEWQTLKTSFVINEATTGNVVIDFAAGGGVRSDFVIDNVRLLGVDLAYFKNQFEAKKTEVENLMNDETYNNIKGEERTKIKTIIEGTYTTIEDYENAVNYLNTAISTFKSALTNYNNLEAAKALIETKLPYASDAKYTALETAKNCETATSASDADAKTNAIIAARRAYVESNGKAEGVEGAEDYTSKVVNADFADGLNGWTSGPAKDSEVRTLSSETWTNADGTKGGAYFNYWNDSANNQHIWQDVAGLAAGKYIVTVKARGTVGFWMKLRINNEDATSIDAIGNTGGTFDRGWNDYTAEFTVSKNGTVRIDVGNYKPSGVNNKKGWFGVGDVRLVRLGDLDAITLDENTLTDFHAGAANVTLKRTLVADKWNTLVLPFDVAADDVKALLGDDVKIVNYTNSDEENIVFNTTEEGIKANVPVLIKPAKVADNNTYTFDGATLVEGSPIAEGTGFDFVGRYGGKYQLNLDEYMLFGDKWWKTEEGDSYSIKGFRAYIRAKALQGAAAAKSLNLVIDGQTTGLKLNTIDGTVEGEAYNLAGQRIGKSYKGIVVKNGKKMIKK